MVNKVSHIKTPDMNLFHNPMFLLVNMPSAHVSEIKINSSSQQHTPAENLRVLTYVNLPLDTVSWNLYLQLNRVFLLYIQNTLFLFQNTARVHSLDWTKKWNLSGVIIIEGRIHGMTFIWLVLEVQPSSWYVFYHGMPSRLRPQSWLRPLDSIRTK